MNVKDKAFFSVMVEKLLNKEYGREILADEIEAYLLQVTTQRSPEWRGRANC